MLLRGIAQGHPFVDAKKRTGFLVASYYLVAISQALPASTPRGGGNQFVRARLRRMAPEVRKKRG